MRRQHARPRHRMRTRRWLDWCLSRCRGDAWCDPSTGKMVPHRDLVRAAAWQRLREDLIGGTLVVGGSDWEPPEYMRVAIEAARDSDLNVAAIYALLARATELTAGVVIDHSAPIGDTVLSGDPLPMRSATSDAIPGRNSAATSPPPQ